MMTPLISVVIPVYNTEPYLAACIESIMQQREQNWEMVLVNDGSTDSSGEICRMFSEKDKRIKYIQQENKGVSAARNNGLRQATGKWVTFLDSDDLLENFAFDVVKDIPDDCGIAISGFTLGIGKGVQAKGGTIFDAREIRTSILNFSQFKKYHPDCTSIDDISKWSSCGRFYKTDILKNANIFVSERLKLGEDLAFSMKVLNHIEKVWVDNSQIYYYRPNPGSATRTFRKDRISNTEILVQEVAETVDLQTDKKEFSRFVLTLITEGCFDYFADTRSGLNYQQAHEQLKQLCQKKWFDFAIRECDYRLLAYGKRNRIKIAITLFCLKCRQPGLLLKLIRAFLWRIN